MANVLSDKELALTDAYWRAANYLSVGQIYLYDNPLLKKPLTKEHIKPRLLGLFLLKICRPRISGGLRTGPLLIGHGQMALDRPRDTAVGGSHAGTTSAGEPGASAATRRVEGPPTTTAAERHGPNVLGSAVETIDELAAFVAGGPARDGGWLAPARVSTLLGLEESATFRSPRDQCGPPCPDSANELRQSSLGRAKNPR